MQRTTPPHLSRMQAPPLELQALLKSSCLAVCLSERTMRSECFPIVQIHTIAISKNKIKIIDTISGGALQWGWKPSCRHWSLCWERRGRGGWGGDPLQTSTGKHALPIQTIWSKLTENQCNIEWNLNSILCRLTCTRRSWGRGTGGRLWWKSLVLLRHFSRWVVHSLRFLGVLVGVICH